MTTTIVAPEPVAVESTVAEPDTLHLVCCCNLDVALCGTDVSNEEWAWQGDECVVCTDLSQNAIPCRGCGHTSACPCCACGCCRPTEVGGGDSSCPGS